MAEQFPVEYHLESGTKVTVDKISERNFNFTLQPKEGNASQFTYVHDESTKGEWDDELEFEQLDALKAFWIKYEDDLET